MKMKVRTRLQKIKVSLALFKMGIFGAAHRWWGGGGGGKKASPP